MVDLIKLGEELVGVVDGVVALGDVLIVDCESTRFLVYTNGNICDASDSVINPVLDIIQRHVAPVAPDPGLREAIAKRMYEDADAIAVSQGGSPVAWEDCGSQQKWYYRRAESAMAVLAERGGCAVIGDKVWLPAAVIREYPLGDYLDVQPDDADEIFVSVGGVIPDVPNLAHIARYLTDHPETVDALALCHSWLNGIDVPWPDDLCEAATRLLDLTQAMRGEGGHDAG